ncbi:hypothetical protein LTR85_002002 [Meristemomyces frigidus]|nr:hypothetical protein LTR85_002002 [Meristemomyces frigidus]
MGWGKKGEKSKEEPAADSSRLRLFSKRSQDAKPPPVNPYSAAPPPGPNPYANHNAADDRYAAPRSQSSLTQPPTSSFGSLTLNSEQGGPPGYARSVTPTNRPEKSPVPPGGYGGGAPRYQAQGSSSQAAGYGGDAYGNGQSRYGASGYGGLGRSNSQDTVSTDVVRGALFGDAPQRAQQQQQQQQTLAPQPPSDPSYSNSGGYDSADMPGGYGAGPERELTAEELEDQDVQAAKSEIRFIKQQDVASTRNARRIAEQAEQTGRETLERLGAQGDRIHNTERNLDLASINNRHAEEKARELRTLNRSMWAVHVPNPFTKEAKHERMLQEDLVKHQKERRDKEDTRKAAFSTEARHQAQQRDIRGNALPGKQKSSLADRAKFQFEADSEDEEMENEIEGNIDAIGSSVRVLKNVAQAMNGELTSQNAHIDRIAGKTDKVDDGIALNTARLESIYKRG